jgi:uncharacterized membrane protein
VTSGAYLFLILALVLAGGTWLTLRLERLEREVDRLRAALQQAEQPAGVAPPTRDREMRAPEPVLPTASFFERLVGGRLLIWTGGVALAAAGIFLIRHSIELVTPAARMIASALLGAALIVAGEYARRGRFLSDDPRIAQALVGAGLAVLYATAYGSHILFGLIGGGTAFVLMVAITAAALGLSLRHGLPTAALGLIGGVLAPALVGDADAGALPVLAYLALLDAAVFALAWRRGWGWLAAVAVLASFAWTGVFVLGEAEDAWPAALFAGLLGVIASLPRREEGRAIGFVQPMVLALIQAAVLVGRSDVGAGAWLLFGGLAAAGLVLAAIRPSEKLAPAAALFLALILIGAEAEGDPFTPYAALGTALLLGGGGAWLAVRGQRKQTLVACAALAGPLLLMRMIEPDLIGRAGYGTLALVAAGLALGLLALLRRAADRSRLEPMAAAGTAALLLAVAVNDLLPRDYVSAGWLVASLALLAPGMRWRDEALRLAGLGLLTATVLKAFLVDAAELGGVLRILSFLGLGVALIGIGLLYGRVLGRGESGARPKAPSGESFGRMRPPDAFGSE